MPMIGPTTIRTITRGQRTLALVPEAHEVKGPATEFEEEAAEMMLSVLPSVLAILRLLEDVAMWMRMEPQASLRVDALVAARAMILISQLVVDQETLSRSVELILILISPVTFRTTMRVMRHPLNPPSSVPAATPTTDLTM